MALVQIMKSAGTKTFGELASKYFNVITSSVIKFKDVHIVFDQYWDLSMKAGEHALQGSLNLEVKIYGLSTPVPIQWGKFKSSKQRKSLPYSDIFGSESSGIWSRYPYTCVMLY